MAEPHLALDEDNITMMTIYLIQETNSPKLIKLIIGLFFVIWDVLILYGMFSDGMFSDSDV